MNVRQFSMGDLADILISPEPVTTVRSGSDDVEYEYADEFEDDFEEEDTEDEERESYRNVKSPDRDDGQDRDQFDISKSEDSRLFSNHVEQLPNHSQSVSGSDEEDEEKENSGSKNISTGTGKGVRRSPEETLSNNATKAVLASLTSKPSSSTFVPDSTATFRGSLLAPPVAPKLTFPSTVFDEPPIASPGTLPAGMNDHPVPTVHFSSRKNTFAEGGQGSNEQAGVEQSLSEYDSEADKMFKAVRGPATRGVPAFSRVRRVAAWEVPGGTNSGQNDTSSTVTAQTDLCVDVGKAHHEDDRAQMILIVLELLQSAAKKSEAVREAEFAIKSAATAHFSSFHAGGVTRAQAMQANGKFFMSRVPDYDPDFDAALQFLNEASSDQNQESQQLQLQQKRERAARAELSTLHETREMLRLKREAQQSWDREANASSESPFLGSVGGGEGEVPSPDASIQVMQSGARERERERNRDATREIMTNRNRTGNPYRTNNKTYPSGTTPGSASSSSKEKENDNIAVAIANKTHPMSTRSVGEGAGASAQPRNLTWARAGAGVPGKEPFPSSPDTLNGSATNSSPGSSPGRPASPLQQQQAYGGWPVPLHKRKDILASIPAARASELNSTCESLYASFLADLIGNCKKRANECRDTEEMAMLRALSDHVLTTFSGERLEDVQCKMLQGAVNAIEKIGSNKPGGGRTPLTQRLENPLR